MTDPAAATAALELVGAPFRLRGRDPATGLDCLGVVVHVLGRIGGNACIAKAYGLRNSDIKGLLEDAEASGLVPTRGRAAPGTVVLFDLGAGQHHLAIAAGNECFVHAHAGLRKVVYGKIDPSWKTVATWRFPTRLKD
ncbi:NlpC/P60 family protein [Croceicoccus sediminis]|uniref:NlpC/P60 family protein n=1 Tax=Croceicoccus sediminis TaxID=2571150 RepID=UPI0011822F47|nr:NlpC/P60 family protein [Croceicoccus sediminis]